MTSERKDIRFNNPTINKLKFEINNSFNIELFEGFDNLKYDLDILDKDPEIKNTEELLNDSSLVILNLVIGAMEDKYPFRVEIEYKAIFEWEKHSDVDKDDFLRINAPAILYSYCRPVISSVTGYSDFPPLDLPFYNFTKEKN